MKNKVQTEKLSSDPGLDAEDLAARDILEGVAKDYEDDPNVDTENFHEPGSEQADFKVTGEYGASQIQILEGLEAVRRPAWYVYRQHFVQRTAPSGI